MVNQYKKIEKKIVVFDLDGTLTASKASLDPEMATLLHRLLEKKIVAVMGGGSYDQFQKQLLTYLQCTASPMHNMFILPTSGASLYKYDHQKLQLIYQCVLTEKEKKQITHAFKKAFQDIHYISPKKTYGKLIEDRESQITFSALGQQTPLIKKEQWNKTQDIRFKLKSILEKYLPKFEVRIAGLTSIDITKKGIDKGYGVRAISKLLAVPIKKMVYIGDALFQGGNDAAVIPTGIDTIQVSGPQDVKYFISRFLKK